MTSSTQADTDGKGIKTTRTAVIFVHGQGEQSPMKDVHELVNAVWTNEESGLDKVKQRELDDQSYLQNIESENNTAKFDDSSTWNIPNFGSELHDIRRLTTDKTKDGQRFSFYEFYWADLMTGSRLSHVTNWLATCLRVSAESTPSHLKPLRHLVYAISYIFGFWVLSFAIFSSLMMIGTLSAELPKWLAKTLESLWLSLAILSTICLLLMSVQVSSKSDSTPAGIYSYYKHIVSQVLIKLRKIAHLILMQLKWIAPLIGLLVLLSFAVKPPSVGIEGTSNAPVTTEIFKASMAILLLSLIHI